MLFFPQKWGTVRFHLETGEPGSWVGEDLLANYVAQMGEPSLVGRTWHSACSSLCHVWWISWGFLGAGWSPETCHGVNFWCLWIWDPDDMALLRCHVIHSHRSHRFEVKRILFSFQTFIEQSILDHWSWLSFSSSRTTDIHDRSW